jgi:hypothetical protein
MRIEVVKADATKADADVLVLKYAQDRFGVDRIVAERLIAAGRSQGIMSPRPGGFRILPSCEGVAAQKILFMGVVSLSYFGYPEIREFGCRLLSALAGESPSIKTIVTTAHGANYGLDEIEAFASLVAGFSDAARSGDLPEALETIVIAEQNAGRADRLAVALQEIVPGGEIKTGKDSRTKRAVTARDLLRGVGRDSNAKPHVFVAMPFSKKMEDIYHFGIFKPVRRAQLVCERADLAAFTGDVMKWVQERIQTASLVVADLTNANPNVYLEVGFAWGCGVPTVLLADDVKHLRFDTQGQRCLLYESIKDLEIKLASELKGLDGASPNTRKLKSTRRDPPE